MEEPEKDLVDAIAFALRGLDPWPRASDLNLPSRRLARAVAEHLKRCGFIIKSRPAAAPPDTGRLMRDDAS